MNLSARAGGGRGGAAFRGWKCWQVPLFFAEPYPMQLAGAGGRHICALHSPGGHCPGDSLRLNPIQLTRLA